MKIRTGFVSNSSSASFILKKKGLTQKQIDMIYNHIEEARRCKDFDFGYVDLHDRWRIDEDDDCITGYAGMDNFDMKVYLHDFLGISSKNIEWEKNG